MVCSRTCVAEAVEGRRSISRRQRKPLWVVERDNPGAVANLCQLHKDLRTALYPLATPLLSRPPAARQNARKWWYGSVAITMRRAPLALALAAAVKRGARPVHPPNVMRLQSQNVAGPLADPRTTDIVRNNVATTGSSKLSRSVRCPRIREWTHSPTSPKR